MLFIVHLPLNRRSNETRTHIATWARASSLHRFMDTNVYGTGYVKIWKTRHKISVDIRSLYLLQWCTSTYSISFRTWNSSCLLRRHQTYKTRSPSRYTSSIGRRPRGPVCSALRPVVLQPFHNTRSDGTRPNVRLSFLMLLAASSEYDWMIRQCWPALRKHLKRKTLTFWYFSNISGNFWPYFTEHVRKQLYISFRRKIWHRYSILWPQFPYRER